VIIFDTCEISAAEYSNRNVNLRMSCLEPINMSHSSIFFTTAPELSWTLLNSSQVLNNCAYSPLSNSHTFLCLYAVCVFVSMHVTYHVDVYCMYTFYFHNLVKYIWCDITNACIPHTQLLAIDSIYPYSLST
jgi:hypothetical protein